MFDDQWTVIDHLISAPVIFFLLMSHILQPRRLSAHSRTSDQSSWRSYRQFILPQQVRLFYCQFLPFLLTIYFWLYYVPAVPRKWTSKSLWRCWHTFVLFLETLMPLPKIWILVKPNSSVWVLNVECFSSSEIYVIGRMIKHL